MDGGGGGGGGNGGPNGNDYGGGGGNGNGNGNGNVYSSYVLSIITTNLKNPCIKSTYDLISSKDFSNDITRILRDVFAASAKFNLTITETTALGYNQDGHTIAVDRGNGILDITLQLNLNTLPSAAKEFTAATIYHEVLHAYLRTTGLTGKLEHESSIANNYQSSIVAALQEAFPGLSYENANALAWGGLEETDAFNRLPQIQRQNFTEINNYFHAATPGYGTKC